MVWKPVIPAAVLLVAVGGWWLWKGWAEPERTGGSSDGSKAVDARPLVKRGSAETARCLILRDYRAELDERKLISSLLGRELFEDRRAISVIKEWASFDPQAAFDWGAKEGNPVLQDLAIEEVSGKDLANAKYLIEKLSEANPVWPGVGKFLTAYAKVDREAALVYVKESFKESSLLGDALGRIFPEFARHDVPRALEVLDESNFTWLVAPLAAEWVKVDLEGALGWVNKLTGDDKLLGPMAICAEWVRIDPEAALEYALALEDESPAMESLMAAWGRHDPQAAIQWLETSEFARNSEDTMLIFGGWVEARPKEALIALSEVDDSEMTQHLANQIFLSLWHASPSDAAQCFMLLSEDMRASSVGLLVTKWHEIDPQEVETWIISLEDNHLKDLGLEALVMTAAEDEPELAIEWLKQVLDSVRREEVLNKVGPVWLYQRKSLAREWLSGLGVPSERIQSFERKVSEQVSAIDSRASKKEQ
jgi:hypothetical protein